MSLRGGAADEAIPGIREAWRGVRLVGEDRRTGGDGRSRSFDLRNRYTATGGDDEVDWDDA